MPFSPGGGSDLVGRLLGQKLAPLLGQQVVVENRAGAAGRIGTELVAKAAPDGYTLLLATSSVMVGAATYSRLPFEMPKDFSPISFVAYTTYVLVAHPSVPVKFSNILPALPAIRSSRLRPLGITSLRRSSLLPDVPTIAESGLPGFEVERSMEYWRRPQPRATSSGG